MQIDFLSLFPEAFSGFFDPPPFHFVIREGLIRVRVHNFCQRVGAASSMILRGPTPRGDAKILCAEPVTTCVNDVALLDVASRTVFSSRFWTSSR